MMALEARSRVDGGILSFATEDQTHIRRHAQCESRRSIAVLGRAHKACRTPEVVSAVHVHDTSYFLLDQVVAAERAVGVALGLEQVSEIGCHPDRCDVDRTIWCCRERLAICLGRVRHVRRAGHRPREGGVARELRQVLILPQGVVEVRVTVRTELAFEGSQQNGVVAVEVVDRRDTADPQRTAGVVKYRLGRVGWSQIPLSYFC